MNESKKVRNPLQVGVVGCGGIAQVIHLPILAKNNEVRITALCDKDTSKAAILADKLMVDNIYEDISDMLNHEDLDVVFILTPNNLHLPMSLLALEYGAHVFIEKPAVKNREQAERILQQAKQSDKTVMIGMQNRFRSDVRALHRFVEGGELGKLFFIKAGWLQAQHQSAMQTWLLSRGISGGGVVMDLGIQVIDLVWWLLGRPAPKSVKSFAYQINTNINVEDFCVSCITFEGQLSFSIEVSWDFPISSDRFYVEMVGEKGTGTLNPLKLQKIMHGQIMNITQDLKETKIANFKLGYQNEVQHFIDFLNGRIGRLESTVEDAVQVFRIIDAIYEAARSGKEVVL